MTLKCRLPYWLRNAFVLSIPPNKAVQFKAKTEFYREHSGRAA